MAGRGKTKEVEVVKTKKEILYDEINALVKEYNDSADFAEHKRMKKLNEKISEKVQAYTEEVKSECYDRLLKTDNPLFAAADEIYFDTISVREKSQEEGGKKLVVDETGSRVFIDPLDLHEKTEDGIGVDTTWNTKVAGLNFAIAVRLGVQLGLSPEKLAEMTKNYKASEEAKKLECFIRDDDAGTFDIVAANEHMQANMQKVIDAMIGSKYIVTNDMVTFTLQAYSTVDNTAKVGLVFAKHANFRKYMLKICNWAITGNKPEIKYPTKKR